MNNIQEDIKASISRLPEDDQKLIFDLITDIESKRFNQRQMREQLLNKIQQLIATRG